MSPDSVNLTKVELDDLKRKVDLIAANVAKVANENERLVRSQEQWAANFSERQKVQDVTAKLTIENDKVKLLESQVRDAGLEIKKYQESLEAQDNRIKALEAEMTSLKAKLERVSVERDEAVNAKAIVDAALAENTLKNEALDQERQNAVSRGDELSSSLSKAQAECSEKTEELRSLVAGISSRLSQFMPQGILESKIGPQVSAFDAAAAAGDQASLRVMAGLTQLRAAFVAGAGPDDKLIAVKSIGSALYAAWSAQSKDAKATHVLFAEWQNFLNDLPGAGYQLVVPDLGQSVPPNVTAPVGVTKVTEVQLWIIKGEAGAIYSRGVVR